MSRIETSGLQLEERRVAIEILSIRERTRQAVIVVKWCDPDQKLADGLSKPFHCDQLVDLLRLGLISIVFEPLFVSAKKKKLMQRQEPKEKAQVVDLPEKSVVSSQQEKDRCEMKPRLDGITSPLGHCHCHWRW